MALERSPEFLALQALFKHSCINLSNIRNIDQPDLAMSESGPMDQLLCKEFNFYLWWLFCSAEQHRFGSFGRMPYEEHLCEITLNFDHWFEKFLIYNSGGLLVW